MTKGILAGAALAALVSAGATQAQTCASSCNAQHTTCTQAGRDYATCMGVWHQCKTACLTPARAPVSAPPKVQTAVVRR